MSDGEIDLGSGYTYRTFTCEGNDDEPIGLIITGPAPPQCPYRNTSATDAGPNRCGGGLHFENSPERFVRKPDGTMRPRWKVVSKNPLSLQPSIKCKCEGQHGYITNGRYVNAGGIIE